LLRNAKVKVKKYRVSNPENVVFKSRICKDESNLENKPRFYNFDKKTNTEYFSLHGSSV